MTHQILRKKKLKIISFNIKSCQECNLMELIEYFKKKKPDVICLQEVDKCSKYCEQDICKEFINEFGYESKYLKTVKRKGFGEFGICIFSKYKILDYQEYYYSNYDEKRGIQKISISVPFLKKKINIFNTHLDYKNVRDQQVVECLNFISRFELSDFILCGDLNLNPKSIIYGKISDYFKEIKYNTTYSYKRPKEIIDYILINKNSKLSIEYEVENVKLSDHKPLISNIF